MKDKRFRFVLLDGGYEDDTETVAEIYGKYYSVIGNGNDLEVKNLKKDWGRKSKWGRWIK